MPSLPLHTAAALRPNARCRSTPTRGPRDAAPPRRAALGAPARGPPPQCAPPLRPDTRLSRRRPAATHGPWGAGRGPTAQPDAAPAPALHLRVDCCFTSRATPSTPQPADAHLDAPSSTKFPVRHLLIHGCSRPN